MKWTRAAKGGEHGLGVVLGLACAISRLADRCSTIATWQMGAEKIGHTFARFALPVTWDFCEVMPWADSSGGYLQGIQWVSEVFEHLSASAPPGATGSALRASAQQDSLGGFDIVLTDPPYYDAIPYSDCMDFFYVWLRRTLHGLSTEIDRAFGEPLSPKWDHATGDG